MRYTTLSIAVLGALVLAGCASKSKPPLTSAVASDLPGAAPNVAPPPEPSPGGIAPGTQADLAATAGDRVYFALDRFDLEAQAHETLTRQATWLGRYPSVKVLIAGNADERGTREYNVALGGRRAEATRQALIAKGVASARIQTVSYGKERPVDPRPTEEGWARNRNAQTVLLGVVGLDW